MEKKTTNRGQTDTTALLSSDSPQGQKPLVLKEAQLRDIIREIVERILSENTERILKEAFSPLAPKFSQLVQKHGGINDRVTSHPLLQYIQDLTDNEIAQLINQKNQALHVGWIVFNDGAQMALSADGVDAANSKAAQRTVQNLDRLSDPLYRKALK